MNGRRIRASVLAAVVVLGLLAATSAFSADPPLPITIMTRTFSGDPVRDDAETMKAVESYCNVDLKITWVPSTNYDDKLNLALASGDLPMVMLTGSKTPSIVKAVRDGAFWEIGPYLQEFPNLKTAHPVTLWNSSFEGRTYGLYSMRPLGRNGLMYRSDWLKKLGMQPPKTIDDFYNMLVAFRDKDPDGNGKNDTYGMVATTYNGPFLIMLTWFGAPNGWGEDGSGGLQPTFFTSEYMDCLRFWRKMYVEKLINEDFGSMDPNKWNDPVLNDKAGAIIDVINSRPNSLNNLFEQNKPGAYVDIVGAITGPKGPRSMATTGYGSLFMFARGSIRDVATLRKVLAFEDKLGDRKMLDVVQRGIEGKHYQLVNGAVRVRPVTDLTYPKNDWQDFNQILSFITAQGETPLEMKPWQTRSEVVMKEAEPYVVGDPTTPFVSPTMGTKGAQLNTIIEDARVKFIAGQINEQGFRDAVALWRKTGGDQVIKEFSDDYRKNKK